MESKNTENQITHSTVNTKLSTNITQYNENKIYANNVKLGSNASSNDENKEIKHLKIVTINVQSIKSKHKQAQLNLFCKNENPDIILGTESHLDEDFLDSEVFHKNYEIIRKDRNRHGGGVFISFRNTLLITEVTEATHNMSNECIIGKLETVNYPPLYLGAFYRPTNNDENPLLELDKQIGFLTNNKHALPHIVIAGDFNVPSIDWEKSRITPNPQYGIKINQLILDIADNHSFIRRSMNQHTEIICLMLYSLHRLI